ncbi:MAG: ABC-2 transporter permease [Oscillospiraceae bacterium]
MFGLILKDMYISRKYIKMCGIVILICTVLAIFVPAFYNYFNFITSFLVLIGSLVVVTTFAYDNLAKWDVFAATMPISRAKIIISKYIFTLIFVTITTTISIGIVVAVRLINRENIEFTAFLPPLVSLAMGLFVTSVIIPITVKFGVEKSRIILIMLMTVPLVIGGILQSLGASAPTENAIKTVIMLLPLIILALFVISIGVSIKLFQNKEL